MLADYYVPPTRVHRTANSTSRSSANNEKPNGASPQMQNPYYVSPAKVRKTLNQLGFLLWEDGRIRTSSSSKRQHSFVFDSPRPNTSSVISSSSCSSPSSYYGNSLRKSEEPRQLQRKVEVSPFRLVSSSKPFSKPKINNCSHLSTLSSSYLKSSTDSSKFDDSTAAEFISYDNYFPNSQTAINTSPSCYKVPESFQTYSNRRTFRLPSRNSRRSSTESLKSNSNISSRVPCENNHNNIQQTRNQVKASVLTSPKLIPSFNVKRHFRCNFLLDSVVKIIEKQVENATEGQRSLQPTRSDLSKVSMDITAMKISTPPRQKPQSKRAPSTPKVSSTEFVGTSHVTPESSRLILTQKDSSVKKRVVIPSSKLISSSMSGNFLKELANKMTTNKEPSGHGFSPWIQLRKATFEDEEEDISKIVEYI